MLYYYVCGGRSLLKTVNEKHFLIHMFVLAVSQFSRDLVDGGKEKKGVGEPGENCFYPSVKYYSAMKRNDLLIHSTIWMDLGNMLRERGQSQKNTLCDFIHRKCTE